MSDEIINKNVFLNEDLPHPNPLLQGEGTFLLPLLLGEERGEVLISIILKSFQ